MKFKLFLPDSGKKAMDLMNLLRESNQEIPPELQRMAGSGGYGGGGGFGGSRFGGGGGRGVHA